MKEIALILIIEKIAFVLGVFAVILLLVAFFIGLFAFMDYDNYSDKESLKSRMKLFTPICITGAVLFIISVFMPSRNDMYTYFGVGGVIDYVQKDDKTKELPEKCVVALDKLLEEYTEDGSETK